MPKSLTRASAGLGDRPPQLDTDSAGWARVRGCGKKWCLHAPGSAHGHLRAEPVARSPCAPSDQGALLLRGQWARTRARRRIGAPAHGGIRRGHPHTGETSHTDLKGDCCNDRYTSDAIHFSLESVDDALIVNLRADRQQCLRPPTASLGRQRPRQQIRRLIASTPSRGTGPPSVPRERVRSGCRSSNTQWADRAAGTLADWPEETRRVFGSLPVSARPQPRSRPHRPGARPRSHW